MITAGAAVFAGLGGAGLTALINRKNTKDTLTAARLTAEEQRQQTHRREHEIWLRDQKLEAYTDFLATSDALLHDVASNPLGDKTHLSVAELATKRGKVKVLGDPEARKIAREIVQEFSPLLRAQRKASFASQDPAETGSERIPNRAELLRPVRESAGRVAALNAKFVRVIRNDLGAATDRDADVDARNQDFINRMTKSETNEETVLAESGN